MITKIIYNYLDYIHKTKLSDKFETIFDILNEMRSIRYIENQNNKVFITESIGKQIDICDAFEVKIPEGCAPAQARTTKQVAPSFPQGAASDELLRGENEPKLREPFRHAAERPAPAPARPGFLADAAAGRRCPLLTCIGKMAH